MSKKHRDKNPQPKSDDEPRLGEVWADAAAIRRPCNIAITIVAFVMLLILVALSTTHVLWPDAHYSDMNTLMSGENFATHGLLRLRLLPVHHLGPMTDPPSYYTHYPPLPNAMNGLMQSVGIGSLALMRILCGVLGIAGLVLMVLAFARDIGHVAAVCGLIFIATTGHFFTYSMSVHQHPYNMFFIGVFVFFFVRAVRGEGSIVRAWIICWVALMLESLTSFELIFYPQVFAWIYVLATGRIRKLWKMLIVLGTAPLAGVGLHFVQNCWALGWSDAVTDAGDAFSRPGRGPAQDRWQMLARVPEFIRTHSQRLFYWSWPALPVLAAIWLPWKSRTRDEGSEAHHPVALVAALLAASTTWYVFMPTHTLKHPITISQLVPLMIVVMGGAIEVAVRWLVSPRVAPAGRVLAAVALIVVGFGQMQTIGECFERARTRRPNSFYLFEALGDDAFPRNAAILTNTFADAQMAYFVRRPLFRLPTSVLPFEPESLAEIQSRLPDGVELTHYLFDTSGDRSAFKILASTCRGKLAAIPGGRGGNALIIFDIKPLLARSGKAAKLPKDVRNAQRQGKFENWAPTGWLERLNRVLVRHGKL